MAEQAPLSDVSLRIDEAAFVRPPVWMIGPRSYFSDSAVPLVDVVAVPARQMRAEHLELSGHSTPRQTRSFLRRREKAMHPFSARTPERPGTDRYCVDLRPFGLANWSHALNKAIPVAVMVRDHLAGQRQPAPRCILDAKMSGKILGLFDAFGLETLTTDRIVEAPLIDISVSNKALIDRRAREILASVAGEVDGLIASAPHVDKVFINRKAPSRSFTNNDQIKGMLEPLGYREIFLEEHSAAEQLAILLKARDILAIHGAGLAPLMFRRPEHGAFRFIEVATPGHIVPFFRDMVDGLPCTYRMIRGVPDAAMSAEAFANLEPPSLQFKHAHASKPFQLDPVSLQFALDSLEDEAFPMGTIETPLQGTQP